MFDIWGLVLLILSMAGAIKGRWLPFWIPQLATLLALFLLIYRGIWARSRLSFIHTSAVWVSLTWIAGKAMELSWGRGILSEVPFWTMLLVTPLIAYIHQRIYRRFNPVPTRGLELESVTQPIRWSFSKKKTKGQTIELITFDLGEEIQFKNK